MGLIGEYETRICEENSCCSFIVVGSNKLEGKIEIPVDNFECVWVRQFRMATVV